MIYECYLDSKEKVKEQSLRRRISWHDQWLFFLSFAEPSGLPSNATHSPSTSPPRARNLRPCRHPARTVSAPPPRHASSHAATNFVARNELLPLPIYNILTREELIFSMETQVNKLVISHFSAQLKTLAINVISCLGRVILPAQYKIYLDPLLTVWR